MRDSAEQIITSTGILVDPKSTARRNGKLKVLSYCSIGKQIIIASHRYNGRRIRVFDSFLADFFFAAAGANCCQRSQFNPFFVFNCCEDEVKHWGWKKREEKFAIVEFFWGWFVNWVVAGCKNQWLWEIYVILNDILERCLPDTTLVAYKYNDSNPVKLEH